MRDVSGFAAMAAKRPRHRDAIALHVSYVALRFDAPAAEADAWSDALLDAGALSVDVSDPAAGTADETPQYGEPGEPWRSAVADVARCRRCSRRTPIRRAALRAASAAIALPLPPHETYVRSPSRIGCARRRRNSGRSRSPPGFWIVPSWSQAPDPGALNLRLDPGLAFGTGSHPTTRLCLEWLRAHIRGGESLLDYGCGSGILAIAGARAGRRPRRRHRRRSAGDARKRGQRARERRRARRSCCPTRSPPATFDIVVANILANPLTLLAPALALRVRPGGRIALSGILEAQADAVAAAYARWFTSRRGRSRDGWVLLAGERGAAPEPSQIMADELFTRCPGCKTIFRVTEPQLALRDGQVRCGHCRTVFNGREHLISLAPLGGRRRRSSTSWRRGRRR